MTSKYLQPTIITVLLVTAALIVWMVGITRHQHLPDSAPVQTNQANPLSVSGSGTQLFTNVSGADLQQAAPPSGSASNTDAAPQKAVPNYCAPGEDPTSSGCVSQACTDNHCAVLSSPSLQ